MGFTSRTDPLTEREIYYFRQRYRNRVFQAVIALFAKKAESLGLTKRELALKLGKDPAQITRWFSGPGNWTLDTISDLLLAMQCEMSSTIDSFDVRDIRQNPTQADNSRIVSYHINLQSAVHGT